MPRILNVFWLLPFELTRVVDLESSSLASARLRAGVAMKSESDDEGGEFRFHAGENPNPAMQIDVLVVGKVVLKGSVDRGGLWLSIARRVKRSGGLVVIDYTDHHLGGDSGVSEFYERILDLADYAVCPSGALCTTLSEHWWGPIHVIEDAIDQLILAPKFTHTAAPVGLWFGHGSNLGYLLQFMYGWGMSQELRLIVLSGSSVEDLVVRPKIPFPPNVRSEFRIWSSHAMVEAARQSDYCIIPSDLNDPRKNGAGTNRLITALAMGLPTAADLLPSYREFANFFMDLRSPLLADWLSAPERYAANVIEAQKQVVPRFSPSVIGAKWRAFLTKLRSAGNLN